MAEKIKLKFLKLEAAKSVVDMALDWHHENMEFKPKRAEFRNLLATNWTRGIHNLLDMELANSFNAPNLENKRPYYLLSLEAKPDAKVLLMNDFAQNEMSSHWRAFSSGDAEEIFEYLTSIIKPHAEKWKQLEAEDFERRMKARQEYREDRIKGVVL